MRIWRVKVRSQHVTKTKRGRRTCVDFCLVEAEDSSQAFERGREFIEGQAPSDVRWLSFEAVEASSVQFPMHIWPTTERHMEIDISPTMATDLELAMSVLADIAVATTDEIQAGDTATLRAVRAKANQTFKLLRGKYPVKVQHAIRADQPSRE